MLRVNTETDSHAVHATAAGGHGELHESVVAGLEQTLRSTAHPVAHVDPGYREG
jgi:hypothetical protein